MSIDLNPPKAGTKEERLVAALNGAGKSIAQISNLLDWKPHTVRAAFTRLRQRGYLIERVPKRGSKAARFRLKDASN